MALIIVEPAASGSDPSQPVIVVENPVKVGEHLRAGNIRAAVEQITVFRSRTNLVNVPTVLSEEELDVTLSRRNLLKRHQ